MRHAPPIAADTTEGLSSKEVHSFWHCHANSGEIVVVTEAAHFHALTIEGETVLMTPGEGA